MEQSLFIKYVQKYFTGIVDKITKTINGKDREPQYLFKSMLTIKQSVDGKWNSITSDNENVVADVVAMDSPLPLKSRPALASKNGDIPKLGMELKLNENQLTAIDTLVAKGADVAEIVQELFDDTKRAYVGIVEQLEFLFLQGLSTGIALTDDDNVGNGVRVDYGYKDANKAGVFKVWSDVTATPVTDVNNMIVKANDDQRSVSYMLMDKATFNLARKTGEGKDLYATYIGNFGNTKPIPTASQFLEAWQDETGLKIILIDRTVKLEKDGVKKTVKAWSEGKVVLLSDLNVGSLVWSKVAEMNHRSKAVEYRIAEEFILLSKYVDHRPTLGEYTRSQARVVPVINNVNEIYLLDSKTVQA